MKGNVYFLNCGSKFVEKFSIATGSVETVDKIYDNRILYAVCGLLDNVFIFGGQLRGYSRDTCAKFDTKLNKWAKISNMSEPRIRTACAIFAGKPVVSGGCYLDEIFMRVNSNTVESYDIFKDEWARMPDMVFRRSGHGLVSVKQKLFAVGRVSSEVFDQRSGKFALVSGSTSVGSSFSLGAVTVGCRYVVCCEEFSKTLLYDADRDEWVEEVSD